MTYFQNFDGKVEEKGKKKYKHVYFGSDNKHKNK
jgi:hypothetical protein